MPNLPFRPKDGFYIKDDFLTNESVGDATIGEQLWELVTIGNAGSQAYLVTTNTVSGRPGILRNTTAGTADGDGDVFRLDEDTIVLDGNPGSFSFGVRYPNITGNQLAGNDFRIGLQDSVTATAPTVGITVFSDAGVVNLRADSADGTDQTAAAAGVSTLTSGTTMVLGTWHDFEVRWYGTNVNGGPANVDLWVDGELAAQISNFNLDNDEEMEPSIVHYQNTGGAATLELDIDYYDLMIQGRG